VGLGANLGDAAQVLRDALAHLDALKATRVVRHSSLYRSAPVDSSGPDYINAVAELVTASPRPSLLAQLQQMELAAGRERPYRNAPRTLDLDLLLYGDGALDSPQLQVPHPRMTSAPSCWCRWPRSHPISWRPARCRPSRARVLTRLPPG
jgi:2-amino-4-hydroxy-6-hydroxymethyldihydropteridine diphosphokinase